MSSTSGLPQPADVISTASIARRFYVHGRSKLQIAEEFGISRFKVARVIDTARKNGLVRVEFDLPVPVDLPLSDELRSAYRLRRALALQPAAEPENRTHLRRRVGALAADLLTEIASEDDVIGLSWARSVNMMTESIRFLPRCPIVQLCGVQAGMDMRDRSVETVQRVADVSGGDAYPIFGPLVLPDRRTAETLRSQPGIAETFSRFRELTKAVVSIGAWQPGESTVYDTLGPPDRKSIGERGTVAEVAARLFDADGTVLTTGLSQRVLAISSEDLQRVPEVIALGYTERKADAIDAVLRSGLVTTLITDSAVAQRLLDGVSRRPPRNPG